MAVRRSKLQSSRAETEPESTERQLVQSLAAILYAGGNTYRAMATLIAPSLAITPFHVIQQSGLLQRKDGREMLRPALSLDQEIPFTVEVTNRAISSARQIGSRYAPPKPAISARYERPSSYSFR